MVKRIEWGKQVKEERAGDMSLYHTPRSEHMPCIPSARRESPAIKRAQDKENELFWDLNSKMNRLNVNEANNLFKQLIANQKERFVHERSRIQAFISSSGRSQVELWKLKKVDSAIELLDLTEQIATKKKNSLATAQGVLPAKNPVPLLAQIVRQTNQAGFRNVPYKTKTLQRLQAKSQKCRR